jgi:hypothetical protein
MSLAIKDIKMIVRNCFDLPAEIPTRCEGLIGSFMKETEYAAGHRKRIPASAPVMDVGESDRSIQIKESIISFLSQLKSGESATMRQIREHSTACSTTTKKLVGDLLELNSVKRVRLVYSGKALYHYRINKGDS